MAVVAGVFGTLRVKVNSVTVTQANVNLVDNNNTPIGAAVSVPIGLVDVTSEPVALNDVLENNEDGRTGVVRWVDPASAFSWSARPDGSNPISTEGWHKIGTAVLA